MGQTKAKWKAGQLAFYDGSTFETVKPLAPIVMVDDFFGDTTNTDIWTEIDTGAGSVVHATSNLTLNVLGAGATDEQGISGKNDKAWNADKGFIFECRMTISQAPTVGAEIIMGIQNDNWTTGANRIFVADERAIFAYFGFYTTVGAGLVAQIHTDDASNDSGIITTGITSDLNTYQVFRIDFTDVSDILFFIDGVGVATSTTFDMSNGTNIMFQPLVMAQMEGAGAGLATCDVDYVRMWQPTR